MLIHPAGLATTGMCPQLGDVPLLWVDNWGDVPLSGLGPHVTQCGQGRNLPPCQVA